MIERFEFMAMGNRVPTLFSILPWELVNAMLNVMLVAD
jgi:hypothetical protein